MIKRKSNLALLLAAIVFCASPIQAQVLDFGGGNKKKDEPKKEVEVNKEVNKKEDKRGSSAGDYGSKKTQEPEVKKPKLSQDEINNRIRKNENSTLKKYDQILQGEKYEVKNLRARVATNRRLVKQYSGLLQKSEEEFKPMRVDFMRRAILLRNDLKDKKITQEKFNRKFRKLHETYKVESGELQADIVFYRKELGRAKSRLADLEDELRIKEEARRAAGDYVNKNGGKGAFTNKEFDKVFNRFRALLPKRLTPVFVNHPFKAPIKSFAKAPKAKKQEKEESGQEKKEESKE